MSTSAESVLHEGRVKWYSIAQGYGFLSLNEDAPSDETEEPAPDIFVHHTVVGEREYLVPGQKVLFALEEGPKGLLATRLEPLE